jgi:hypothetical protein
MEDRIKDLESGERQGGGVGMERIETISGNLSAYTFSNIPATGRHLEIIASLRSTASAESTQLRCRCNGDTGSNYNFLNWDVAKGVSLSDIIESESFAVAQMELGLIQAANGQANIYSPVRVYTPDYLGSHFKRFRFNGARVESLVFKFTFTQVGQGIWKDTSEIDEISIFPASGNFTGSSQASLYAWN